MKHHGKYALPSPEELLRDAENCTPEYMTYQVNRLRIKARNDKRKREKDRERQYNRRRK